MAECIIAGRGSYSTKNINNAALIRVTADSGDTVTCTNQSTTYSQSVSSTKTVEFNVGYGTWTVSSTMSGKSKTVEVTALQIYNVILSGTTYGIQIDMSVSDPADAVTYIDKATGFTPLSCNSSGICNYGSWENIITDWMGVKPCLYLNGQVKGFLNPNNYALLSTGSSADITSGSSGDVMVQFAKRWYKYSVSGNILKFEVADYDRSDEGFVCDAFYSEDSNATLKDYFYYGAYDGYNKSGVLRSISGVAPTTSVSYNTFMTYASANGTGYTIESFYKRMYILGLLMLVTKSRDGQASIGPGRVNSNSSAINTGTMNSKGLFYGTPGTYTNGVKVFGIENFWGNTYKFIAGLVTLGSGAVGVKKCASYSATGADYTSIDPGFGTSALIPTKYASFVGGAIILPTVGQSDTTIGWPDYFVIDSSSGLVAYAGGNWNNNLANSGPFNCNVNNNPDNNNSNYGARSLACLDYI